MSIRSYRTGCTTRIISAVQFQRKCTFRMSVSDFETRFPLATIAGGRVRFCSRSML